MAYYLGLYGILTGLTKSTDHPSSGLYSRYLGCSERAVDSPEPIEPRMARPRMAKRRIHRRSIFQLAGISLDLK